MNESLFRNNWVAATVVALVFYLCLIHGLNTLGLTGPDEPRFAAIARGMAESGDWVTPRLHGSPWFEKPILYYWTAAATFKIFGVSEFAARLPSVLAAALTFFVLTWTAIRFYGLATAQGVALMLPACVASIGFGRAATTDMLFTGWLTAAMAAAAAMFFPSSWCLVGSRASRVWPVLFGFNLGMATLAKGPAAVLLAGGSIAVWILLTRRWGDALRALHPLGIASFVVVALPWYVLCALRNPDFVDVFLVSHNVERFLTPVFRHEQPFWFFGPVLLLGLLPWTPLLMLAARDAVQAWGSRNPQQAWRNSPALFAACWAVFPVLFFSVSQSKLPGYVLPAIPPLILLMARSVVRTRDADDKAFRAALCGVGATLILLALSASYWVSRLPDESPADAANVRLLVLLVAALSAGIAVVGLYGRAGAVLKSAAVMIAAIVLAFHLFFIPALDAHLSPRTAAQVAGQAARGQGIAVHQLHRAWRYGVNYYFHRELPEWSPQLPAETIIVASDAGIQDLLVRGYVVNVVQRVSERAIVIRARPAPVHDLP